MHLLFGQNDVLLAIYLENVVKILILPAKQIVSVSFGGDHTS